MANVDTVRASMQAYLDQDREAAGRLLAGAASSPRPRSSSAAG
jgi:hypothetical protein